MAKRKGVVRKLLAAEALGSTTVILTDKTGTLTQAIMRMSKIITFGVSESELIHHALKNSNVIIENPEDEPEFWRINGRIMEVALAKSSALRGVPVEKIMNKKDVLQYLPFNAAKKFSVSLVKEGNKYFTYFYGAPDILLNHSSFTEEKKKEILEEIDKLSLSGERVLGCARKEVKNIKDYSLAKDLELKNIEFEGLLTFHDPVRPGLQNIIKRVHRAGIRTIIVTGDYKGTALSVAKEVGIFTGEHSVLDGKEIDTLKDLDLKDRLKTVSVISRVTPAHKLRIASILQSMGEIVAMTGDGVNDAPSIKQANVGIAMGSGTEVARDVADLVLLDDNFETIVAAIEEGRQILGNIKKVLVYLLSNVTDGLILIGGSILVGVALPLNALQILWVNFFSDSLPAIAFAFEKDTDGLFGYNTLGNQVKNSINKTGLFDPLMKFLILIIGISTSALLFVIYLYLLRAGYDLELVKTFTFAAFGTYTLLVALSVRSFNKSILSYPVFSNVYLTFGIVVGFVLMAMAIYVPLFQNLFNTVALPLSWVFGVLMVGIFNILLIEIAKWYFRVRRSV
jgi:Ca2+-transporting ATPase